MAVKKKNVKRKMKVWHIYHFRERFELADDVRHCRKSPLLFTKDYVGTGQDDESISYHQQIASLKLRPNWLALRGAFHELKEIAANRSRCYRGYMLDEKFAPATETKISQWLGADAKATRTILAELQSIGLIERVDLPEFDPSINEAPDKETDNSGAHRQAPDSSGGERRPLYKGKDKDKGKSASGNRKGKDKEKSKSAKAEAEKKKKTVNVKKISHHKNNTQTQTKTKDVMPKPILPTESEFTVGSKAKYPQAESLLGSVKSIKSLPTDTQLDRLYAPDTREFASTSAARRGRELQNRQRNIKNI